jgi:hypothetical protein
MRAYNNGRHPETEVKLPASGPGITWDFVQTYSEPLDRLFTNSYRNV